MLVQFSVKDQAKLEQYGAAARATIAAAGGEIVGRFRREEVFAGDFNHSAFLLFTFPDAATAKAWNASADYQALVPLRNEAADMTIVLGEPLG